MNMNWERGYIIAGRPRKITRLADSRLQHEIVQALIHTRGPNPLWYLSVVRKEHSDGLFPLYTADIDEAEKRASRILVTVMPEEFQITLAPA